MCIHTHLILTIPYELSTINFTPSLLAQTVKHLSTMQKIWIQSLGWEDLLGEGNGNPLQYSCLENPMDRGAW